MSDAVGPIYHVIIIPELLRSAAAETFLAERKKRNVSCQGSETPPERITADRQNYVQSHYMLGIPAFGINTWQMEFLILGNDTRAR